MEERDGSEAFLSSDTTTPALATEVTGVNANNETLAKARPLEMLILDWVILIIAVVGLAGNAVVLWLLGFRMRRNAISVYILNLAAADFLFLCCQIINSLCLIIHRPLSSFFEKFLTPVMFGSYVAGLSILSAISTERCLWVLSPIWYRCRRPRHTSAVVCALLWALVLLMSILHSNYCDILHFQYDRCPAFAFFSITYLFFLLVTLSGSSLALLVRMFCGSRRMPLTRRCVTVLLRVLVFLLCGLPLGVCYFLVPWPPTDSVLPCYFFGLLHLLSCVNSCANPIIYFFIGSFRQQQRQNLKLVLQRALQDTPEVRESGGSLGQGTQEMSVSRGEQ